MKAEVAVVKMCRAAQDANTPPTKLARILELTVNKMVGINPRGPEALKIMQDSMLRSAIKAPLALEGITAAAKPRRKRRTKAELQVARVHEKI